MRWATLGLVGALSLGSAAIHFSVAPAHFEESSAVGLAFLALAWFQAAWPLAFIIAPSSWLRLAGVVVNAGAIVVWLASRTVGLPIGPDVGGVEAVGFADVLATVFEIGAVLGLIRIGSVRNARIAPHGLAMGFIGALIVAAGTTSFVLALPPEGHGGDHPSAEEGTEPEPSALPVVQPSTAATPTAGPSASMTPRPEPSAGVTPTAEATQKPASGPARITFATRLDAAGLLREVGEMFRLGQVVVWKAELADAVGTEQMEFVLVQPASDGREFPHWEEPFLPEDPSAASIVGVADLSLYAHGGAGRYVMRYVRGDVVVAEGAFELVE